MTVKEYLLSDHKFNLAQIAKAMYPTNASAATYLNRKLKGTDGRSFTSKDSEKALQVLKSISNEVDKLVL